MAKFQSLRVKSEPSQNLKVTATVPGTGQQPCPLPLALGFRFTLSLILGLSG